MNKVRFHKMSVVVGLPLRIKIKEYSLSDFCDYDAANSFLPFPYGVAIYSTTVFSLFFKLKAKLFQST